MVHFILAFHCSTVYLSFFNEITKTGQRVGADRNLNLFGGKRYLVLASFAACLFTNRNQLELDQTYKL